MTRIAMFCGLVLAMVGTATAQEKKKDVPKELEPFQGTWRVAKQQLRGQDNPKGLSTFGQRFIFAGNKVTMKDGREELFAGTFSADPKKDPAELDFVDAKGEKTQWIYTLDKEGKLSLCFELKLGKDAARPKTFDTKDNSNVVFVLEKEKE